MVQPDDYLFADIERVQQIPIVKTVLEVICRSTGMGFAAVARVTEDRWIACSVQDEIGFGVEPGGELEIATTICNEIRASGNAVVIDHVDENEFYSGHPTPKLYGFKSYISLPIVLKNGSFFGTLCAIDPRPNQLQNPRVIGMFNLFSELLAFHLDSIQLMERTRSAMHELAGQLLVSNDENRQYRHISSHNLQEPLRKLRVFSDMLVNATDRYEVDKAKDLAVKIRSSAQQFSMMIKDLSEFSELNNSSPFEKIDLGNILADVTAQLMPQIERREIIIETDTLPVVQGVRDQIEQLFYQLMHNAVKFAGYEQPPRIRVTAQELALHEIDDLLPEPLQMSYAEIRVEDNGIGIDDSQLEKVFDIFARLPTGSFKQGEGVGLAYCRKIVRNHKGIIKAEPNPGKGTTFVVTLPLF
ncbi:sensor histidine kinase [Dyadobacter beijingensis]|uniref:histidine kinase n=1 Tax=Dyadobacter beijingensis TaxID=365489 RepID=A0ABQ2ICM5_9BACT|nr:GAF domain-containing sensor histidine kinase [Dyadobacter beijingensis]GGN04311.1 sensor histidine kinase [Dyadobacter beijingensis]